MHAAAHIFESKRRWVSSTANSTPASGAANAPVMPAAIPADTTGRGRRKVSFSIPAPMPAPSCTAGPSAPTGTPAKNESAVPTSVDRQSLCHTPSVSPRASASEDGTPLPRPSGKSFVQKAAASPSAAATTTTATESQAFPRAAAAASRESSEASSRSNENRVTTAPASTPVTALLVRSGNSEKTKKSPLPFLAPSSSSVSEKNAILSLARLPYAGANIFLIIHRTRPRRKTLAKFGRSSGFKNTLGFSRKLRILLLKIAFSREVL